MPRHRNTHFIRMPIVLCTALCLPPIDDSPLIAAQRPNQAIPAIDEATRANEAYQAKEWAKAALLYRQVILDQPSNGRAWYRLASSLHALDKQDEAIAAYQKSIEAGVPASIGEYGMALAYGSKHDAEKAFQYLQKATQDGFSGPDRLNSYQELSSLRLDARFAKIVEQAKLERSGWSF